MNWNKSQPPKDRYIILYYNISQNLDFIKKYNILQHVTNKKISTD